MNQKEAVKKIGVRTVYRNNKSGQLFSVVGFGEHVTNKVEEEKEICVIITRKVDEGKADVLLMPVLEFVKVIDGVERFTEII